MKQSRAGRRNVSEGMRMEDKGASILSMMVAVVGILLLAIVAVSVTQEHHEHIENVLAENSLENTAMRHVTNISTKLVQFLPLLAFALVGLIIAVAIWWGLS